MSDLPVLGCAMELHNLENLAPWVLEKDRDLEIQDAYHAFVLDKTADKVADRVRELLGDGYTGRLGIHGPFYGLSLDSVDPAIRKVVRMRLEQALKMGNRMGATQMVLHSPLTLWDRANMLTWATRRARSHWCRIPWATRSRWPRTSALPLCWRTSNTDLAGGPA